MLEKLKKPGEFLERKYKDAGFLIQKQAKLLCYLNLFFIVLLVSADLMYFFILKEDLLSTTSIIRKMFMSLTLLSNIILFRGFYKLGGIILTLGGPIILVVVLHFNPAADVIRAVIMASVIYLFMLLSALFNGRKTVIIVGLMDIVGGLIILMSNPGFLKEDRPYHFLLTYVIISVCFLGVSFLLLNLFNTVMEKIQSTAVSEKQVSENLMTIFDAASKATGEIAASSQNLSKTATGFTNSAQSQASSAEEMIATSEEISASIESIDDNSTRQYEGTQGLVEKMKKYTLTLSGIRGKIVEMLESTQNMQTYTRRGEEYLQRMNDSMATVTDSSKQMNDIINIINDISDRTNLLSLNAAIEAARAGEMGRGFAVVADEISRLADQTTESAKKISQLIDRNESELGESQKHVDKTIESFAEIFKIITLAGELTGEIEAYSSNQLNENETINQEMMSLLKAFQETKTSTSEQKLAMQEFTKTIAFVSELSQSNAEGSEAILTNLGQLSRSAGELERTLQNSEVME